jgi:transposase
MFIMEEQRTTSFLTDEEEQELLTLHRTMKDKRKAYRINAIILLNRGYSKKEVERILLIDRKSIIKYEKDYTKGGIEKLLRDDFIQYSGKLTEKQKVQLVDDLRKNLFSTAKAVGGHVLKKYGVRYTNDGMVKLLHSLGFSYKKTKAVPAKADRQQQEKFVEDYSRLRSNRGENEGIFFLDATHPVYNNLPGYAWIETGKEAEVKTNSGRQRLSINGVYSPITNEVIVREDVTVTDESNIKLFKKIEKTHPELGKIYVIHDNARYNHSKRLREYLEGSRVVMMSLPSYSPNLNVIERLWKLLKKQVLYNKYYENYDDFREAVMNFLNKWVKKNKKALASLMTENFHIYDTC